MRRNIKMRVTPEQSEAVQKIVFANGGGWGFGKKGEVLFTEKEGLTYLCIGCAGGLGITALEKCFSEWVSYEEIDADLFIRTNGTCEEVEYTSSQTTEDIVVRVTEDQAKQVVAGPGVKLDVIPEPKAELIAEYLADANGLRVNDPFVSLALKINGDPNSRYKVAITRVNEPQRRTVTMPDGTVLPEPVREALEYGTRYYVPDLTAYDLFRVFEWRSGDATDTWLERGLIHRTEEDAKAWAEYLLKLTKGV